MRKIPFHASVSTAGAVLLLAGCATVSPKKDVRATQALITARTAAALPAPAADGSPNPDIARTVDQLLAQPLTADSAAQIALLNNRHLRAEFDQIGISEADWVAAGLLRNPELAVGLGFPHIAPSAARLTASFAQDFISLATRPARKKIAAAELDATRLRIAHDALALAAETKRAFYTLQGDRLMLAKFQTARNAERAAAQLALLQHQAGNITDYELTLRQTAYSEFRLQTAQREAALQQHRETLNRLLGLWGWQTGWTIADSLPDLPASEPPLDQLENLALAQRYDLAAGKADYAATARALGLAVNTRFFSDLGLGLQYERDTDRQSTLGPEVSVGVPLFNRGQAAAARLRAQLRQIADQLEARAVDIRADVRAARERLLAARDAALFYRDTLLPEQRRLLALAQQRYNGMFLGAYELLQTKQNELAAERGAIETRRDYWIARTDLEQAVGGSLPAAASTSTAPSSQP